jgi:RIO kinase 1
MVWVRFRRAHDKVHADGIFDCNPSIITIRQTTVSRFNFDDYEDQFDPLQHDRQARRKRKPKAKHQPKKTEQAIRATIASTEVHEQQALATTYRPGLFEEGWLLNSLRSFLDGALITDVLGRVKGGKEASVYRCEGHPSTGADLLAAKVYRPRMFRNLSNDAMYREGRHVLDKDQKEVNSRKARDMKALAKKTAYGQELAHISWMSFEYTTLQQLHARGAAVPQPYAMSENAILMTYYGDEARGAPTLSEVRLSPVEAKSLFEVVLFNIELMLEMGLIHGDLSAYNLLYDEGEIVLIDFPQITHTTSNGNAQFILKRDVQRVCEYFAAQGVKCNAQHVFTHLWRQYGAVEEEIRLSKLAAEQDQ